MRELEKKIAAWPATMALALPEQEDTVHELEESKMRNRVWEGVPVEKGAALVLSSTILSLRAQWLGGLSNRIVALLSSMGIFVVLYGWFGVKALTVVVPVMWLCLALFLSQVGLVALNWRRAFRQARV